MAAESRQHPRAQLAGIDVRYPDVNGDEVVARARDIGRGGLFVETPLFIRELLAELSRQRRITSLPILLGLSSPRVDGSGLRGINRH